MKKDRSDSRFWRCFEVGSVEFGMICGGGMAAGTYATGYFACYGGGHLITFCLIWLACFIMACGLGVNFGRAFKCHNYKDFWLTLYNAKPGSAYGRVVLGVADFYYLIAGFITTGSCVALGGTMIKTVLNGGQGAYIFGCILFGFFFVILTIKGAGLLRKASAAMTLILFACITLVLVVVCYQNSITLGNMLGNFELGADWTGKSLGAGYWKVFSYGAVCFSSAVTLSNTTQKLKDSLDGWLVGIIGGIITVYLFFATAVIVLPYLPAELTNASPILTICLTKLGNSTFFGALYYVILVFAVVSSGPVLTYNVSNRWATVWKTEKLSQTWKLFILGMGVNVGAVLMSLAGLMAIVTKGYSAMGNFILIVLAIPLCLTGFQRIAKKDKENALLAAQQAEE